MHCLRSLQNSGCWESCQWRLSPSAARPCHSLRSGWRWWGARPWRGRGGCPGWRWSAGPHWWWSGWACCPPLSADSWSPQTWSHLPGLTLTYLPPRNKQNKRRNRVHKTNTRNNENHYKSNEIIAYHRNKCHTRLVAYFLAGRVTWRNVRILPGTEI